MKYHGMSDFYAWHVAGLMKEPGSDDGEEGEGGGRVIGVMEPWRKE